MKLQLTRNTGFYGMGSPIEIRKNDQQWIYLRQNEMKEVEITEAELTIQVKFFFLKSNKYTIQNTGKPVLLEVTMNPALLFVYIIFFMGMLFIPVFRLSVVGIFILLILYFIFLVSMFKKAYVIKEKVDGAASRRVSE